MANRMTLMTSLMTMTSLCLALRSGADFSDADHRSRRSSSSKVSPSNGKHVRYPGSANPKGLLYGVLLDAGSSSTKVKVYSYTPGVLPSMVPHVQLQISERVTPGLGHFLSTPLPELEVYMIEALRHAADHVPEHLHASTPVYLMATAGLRVLPASEAKRLLSDVVLVMKNTTTNPFLFSPDHVSILSGEEEAVYAWLAVNYLKGFFSSNMRRQDSVGLLEMGGGSMQVAFLPDGPLYQEEFQVYVGRRRFDLYAQSYLSYGSDYITIQLRRKLLQHGHRFLVGKRLYSPCMLTGDSDKYHSDSMSVKVMGRGNGAECQEMLTQILSAPQSVLCSPGPCAIGDTYQPAVGSHPFYAISAFVYVAKDLNAVEEGGVLNITKLRRAAESYCNLTVDEAVARTGTPAKFASNNCLMAQYIPLLLTKSLGFDEHTDTITVARDINDTHITWTLGAMLQQLSMTFLDDLDSVVSCRRRNRVFPVAIADPTEASDRSGSQPLTVTFSVLSLLLTAMIVSCVWR